MIRALIVAIALGATTPAFAGPADEAARAEYVRLSAELEKLASKNAWEGVERTFRRIVETGIAPDYEDYFHAAHAARSVGDVGHARERLLAANDIREEREVMDWLWEIDSSYGKVSLQCDPGALALAPSSMPFHPDRASAVQFAQAAVAGAGMFEGYLPEGSYTFGSYDVNVVPRVQTVRIDARGADLARKGRKGREGEADTGTVAEGDPQTEQTDAEAQAAAAAAAEAEAQRQAEADAQRLSDAQAKEAARVAAEAERQAQLDDKERLRAERRANRATEPTPGYTLAGMLGVGNNFGGIVGGGAQLVVRPGSGVFGLSGGIGYDVPYKSLGLSLAARVYPHEYVYVAAGVAPLIWYSGQIAGEGVAHGPHLFAGGDIPIGPVRLDLYIGAGAAPAVGKIRPAMSAGGGIGIPFL